MAIPAIPEHPPSAAQLAEAINNWGKSVESLIATVRFSAGELTPGALKPKHTHSAPGYIIFKPPTMLRMLVKAPVVGTDIADMASDGARFSLSLPTKHIFIEGENHQRTKAKNTFENIRPQDIADALFVRPLGSSRYFVEQGGLAEQIAFVLDVVSESPKGTLRLQRKIWFSPGSVQIARYEIFRQDGSMAEQISYNQYNTWQGIAYPREISIWRPAEGYLLRISIRNVTFNKAIAPERFELKRPAGYKLVELGKPKS